MYLFIPHFFQKSFFQHLKLQEMKYFFIFLLILCWGSVERTRGQQITDSLYEDLKINVSVEQPRTYVFTDKQEAFYWGETHRLNRNSWQGLTVCNRTFLRDYMIGIDGRFLGQSRADAQVVVYPDKLVRFYFQSTPDDSAELEAKVTETLHLLPPGVLYIELEGQREHSWQLLPVFASSVSCSLAWDKADQVLWFTKESYLKEHLNKKALPCWMAIASAQPVKWDSTGRQETMSISNCLSPGALVTEKIPRAKFFILVGGSKPELRERLTLLRCRVDELVQQQRGSLLSFLQRSYFHSDNSDFDKALAWAKLSLNGLIMTKMCHGQVGKGRGIFAGLPWFNNYWGRDTFISLPGATYLVGNFSAAREILLDSGRYQLTDSTDWRYGRIPNLITYSDISYNTTDGTWWFVNEARNYFQYTNDWAFAKEIFPIIERAVDGAIKFRVDSLGFLTHGEAETWMDAVGPRGPWSPRGNRAVEIQALWYKALNNAVHLAEELGYEEKAEAWSAWVERVRKSFAKYFWHGDSPCLADHLDNDGTPDLKIRPNQIFALSSDLLNWEQKAKVLKEVVERLTYPYGVASLAPSNSNFHPYHHFEPIYVQDAAYHNGVIWLWLSGPVVSGLVKFGQQDKAFVLTQALQHLILQRGCVGTLPELLDAVPRFGETEPRISGTFSQAWSLAEFVRTLYQDYLGVRIFRGNLLNLTPALPRKLGNVRFGVPLQNGHFGVEYKFTEMKNLYTVQLDASNLGISKVTLTIVLPSGKRLISCAEVKHREKVQFVYDKQHQQIHVHGRLVKLEELPVEISTRKVASLNFCEPVIRTDWPTLQGPQYPLLTGKEATAKNPAARTLVDIFDPEADDVGPNGHYLYPTNENFISGILDITRFTVSYDQNNIYFRLQLRRLHDPGWHPEYGFQLTYAAIAIDQDGISGSGRCQVGMNANYRLPAAWAYERLIYVGGGFRVVDQKEKILAEYRPVGMNYKLGDVAKRTVSFAVPIQYLGRPDDSWRFVVLIGAQDDHGGAGLGDFRKVGQTPATWQGGGGEKLSDNCNVYDFLFSK